MLTRPPMEWTAYGGSGSGSPGIADPHGRDEATSSSEGSASRRGGPSLLLLDEMRVYTEPRNSSSERLLRVAPRRAE